LWHQALVHGALTDFGRDDTMAFTLHSIGIPKIYQN
jgi:hypothetical protein